MTRIEKHFRIQLLAEQIRQLQGDVIVLEDEGTSSGTTQLMLAGIHLAKAAEQLERTPTLDLETTLRLSIASVRDKKRCQQVGGLLAEEEG